MINQKFRVSALIGFAVALYPAIAFADEVHTGEEGLSSISTLGATGVVMGLATAALFHFWPTVKLNGIQMATATLVVITAVVHIGVGLDGELILVLNGIGYLVLLGLLLAPYPALQQRRSLSAGILLVYTVVTIAAYFFQHSIDQFGQLDLFVKGTEVALAALLIVQLLPSKSQPSLAPSPIENRDPNE